MWTVKFTALPNNMGTTAQSSVHTNSIMEPVTIFGVGKMKTALFTLLRFSHYKDGLPHGYEWWLTPKPHIVCDERHWHEGQNHGIEREWNFANKLRRGFPRYWIKGDRVDKNQISSSGEKRSQFAGIPFKDNSPRRKFPPAIEQLFS